MQQEKNILVNRGIPRTPSSPDGFGFNARRVSGPDHSDRAYDAVDYTLDWLDESNTSTEELFNENIRNIAHITNTELAKIRAAVAAVAPTGTDAIEIELRTLKLQLFKARTDHQEHIAIANIYYGHDPLTHKVQDVAGDPILSQQFNSRNLVEIKKGRSAYAKETEQKIGRASCRERVCKYV